MVSPKNIGTSNIIRTEKVTFRNIDVCMYTNMHVTRINGVKRGREFEREQKGVFWGELKKGILGIAEGR